MYQGQCKATLRRKKHYRAQACCMNGDCLHQTSQINAVIGATTITIHRLSKEPTCLNLMQPSHDRTKDYCRCCLPALSLHTVQGALASKS